MLSSQDADRTLAPRTGARRWWQPSTVSGLAAPGLAVGALLWSLQPVLRSRFGLIDDHGIVAILNGHRRLPIGEIPHAVSTTWWEQTARFRPLFWVGQVLECAIAGKAPWIWYTDRILLAMITLMAFYAIAVRLVGPFPAAALAFLPFSGPQVETWNRLGAAEAYAMPLAALGAWWILRVLARGSPVTRTWPGFVLLVLAALSKESFILIALGAVVLVPSVRGLRHLRGRDYAVLAATTVLLALDVLVMLAVQLRYGDFYHQQRSPVSAWEWAWYGLSTMGRAELAGPAAILVVVLAFLAHRTVGHRPILLVAGIVAGIALPQIAFYAGAPQVGRYLYPVAVIPALLWGWVIWVLRTARPVWSPAVVAVLVLALALSGLGGVHRSRTIGAANAYRTTIFEGRLNRMVRLAHRAQVQVVVLQPHDARSDFEADLSLARYLHFTAGLTVMTMPAQVALPTDTNIALDRDLRRWSEEGADALVPYVAPAPDTCLSVVAAGVTPLCRTVAKWPT